MVHHVKKGACQKNCTDYYPFGSVQREAKSPDTRQYRSGYQGQFAEEDQETGWNSFELRMYDPVVGRWTSTDSYGQYWSPYLGMGNDPINGVDPDGGFSKFGAWWRSKFIPNSYTYSVAEKEWAVGWSEWKQGGEGAYLRHFSITEGGPGLSKDFMTFDGVATLGITGTVSPGIGGSFEAGLAIENKPEYLKVRPYFVLEQTWGGDASFGGILNYHKPNEGKINMSDIKGWGETWNGGIGNFDGTYGGNSFWPGVHPDSYSGQHDKYHTYGVGVSAGTMIGFTKNKGYTWVLFND